MVTSLKVASEIRDRTHNLDLENPDHYKIYEDSGLYFIKHNETNKGDPAKQVYDDGKGFSTIGYGFNMNIPGARRIWDQVIGATTSFDEVINGKAKITPEQADALCKFIKNENLSKLRKIYGKAWDKLKPNERIMIEDLYYNGGNNLVGKNTRFYGHVIAYTDTSDKRYLENALTEVKEHSNRERDTNPLVAPGIQNRRNVQAEVGASYKCPLYSKPDDQLLPGNSTIIQAKLNQTIIPRKHGDIDDNCVLSDRFYIWRATLDDKTRPTHAANDGKIFDINNPPSTGNPGDEYNCRCTADFYIPKWVEITDTLNNKHIIRKYITDFSKFPNFTIKYDTRKLNTEMRNNFTGNVLE